MKKIIVNELGERVVTMNLEDRGELTKDEIEMLNKDIPYVYDEDCPPMPKEMSAAMDRAIASNSLRGNVAV